MKKLLLLSMASAMIFSNGCQKSSDMSDKELDIQREEEMNRGDMLEDEYDQSDITPAPTPSNVNKDD